MVAEEILKVGGLLYVMAKGLSHEKERVARDPPRFDFETPTRVFPFRRLNLDVFGEGWLTTPALAFTEVARRATIHLEAMVRALERAQGAELKDRYGIASDREHEARGYAQTVSGQLTELSEVSGELAQAFLSFADRHATPSESPDEGRVDTRLDEALPNASLALLYRAGVRIEHIRVPVRGRVPKDPASELARGFEGSAESSQVLSAELAFGIFSDSRLE
jgi:hypothetical protein